MRDSDGLPVTNESLPLAVVVQPDPMLEERPAGPFRMIATGLGAAAIVILALYGITRPPEPQQMAAAADTQTATHTAPAGGGAANNAGGQAQPANAPAQNPQPNAQRPTTTGQGAGEHAGQPSTTGQGQPKGQAGQSKMPPASGGSATSDVGPGAKPAPQAR
jgi:hypothetical protein